MHLQKKETMKEGKKKKPRNNLSKFLDYQLEYITKLLLQQLLNSVCQGLARLGRRWKWKIIIEK